MGKGYAGDRKDMVNSDTVKLLQECDAGTKMAVTAINEVLENVRDTDMKRLLQESRRHHEKLGDEIHSLLISHGTAEKDPTLLAKGMSWMKTNMKWSMDNSDAAVADLITDGCNMGVKSLNKSLNQYRMADHKSKDIGEKLISIEEKLCGDLEKYL